VSLGRNAAGKRIRKELTAKTKPEALAKRHEFLAKVHDGVGLGQDSYGQTAGTPHRAGCGPLEGDWTVDERPVVIAATRGRVPRYRPIFENWSIEATLHVARG
jgi:hypothetical protein